MAPKDRLQLLEHAASDFSNRAVLEDVTIVCIAPGEHCDALIALLDEEPHPLHYSLARLTPEQRDPTLLYLAAVFKALKGEDPYEH